MNGHAYWYLTRGTGIVALILVTAAVLLGIAASLRAGGARTPRFVVSGLHRNVSLLTVVFIALHVVTTVADGYAPITLLNAVVPFRSAYRPIWLGLGTVASDIILALVITSLVRVRIGLRTWRFIHWFAYACFPIAILHTLGTGTDASERWLLATVVLCVGAVMVAVLMRLWQVRAQRPALASGGAALAIVLPLLGLLWAGNGPLAPGWARRAGTPTDLIGGRRATGSGPTTASTSTALPTPPYSASISGTLSTTGGTPGGTIQVALNGQSADGAAARLGISLDGVADDSGGISTLTGSRVTYGPTARPELYTGTVTSLIGTRITAIVTSSDATPLTLDLTVSLVLDANAGTFAGQLHVA